MNLKDYNLIYIEVVVDRTCPCCVLKVRGSRL
jgi:hypothetical protein